MDAGAFGLLSGLIYAPGIHADADEIAALVTTATRAAGCTPRTCATRPAGVFAALAESIATIRAAVTGAPTGPRLQVSHLKCGARPCGAAPPRPWPFWRPPETRASTSPPTSTRTPPPPRPLRRSSRRALLGLGVEACVAALGDHEVRDRVVAEIERGISGWENVAADPGWAGIRISYAASHPDWAGRSLAELGEALAGPGGAGVRRADRRPARRLRRDRLHGRDRRRDDHGRALDRGLHRRRRAPAGPSDPRRGPPHPRTYGSTARVLGTYVRERGMLSLETAVAKLTSVPAARLGLRDRGVLREGAFADLVVLDPATVADVATYEQPARHPVGIEHVVVNGRLAVAAGAETGERAGPAAAAGRMTARAEAASATTEAPAIAPLPAGPCRIRSAIRPAGAWLAGRDPPRPRRGRHGARHPLGPSRRRAAGGRVPRGTGAVAPPPPRPPRRCPSRAGRPRRRPRRRIASRSRAAVVPIRVVPAVVGVRRSTRRPVRR